MFRILAAEDDDNARFLMCEVLRRAGYEPCPARDGVEALEVMEHYQCDLAVVDLLYMGIIQSDYERFSRSLDKSGAVIADRGYPEA